MACGLATAAFRLSSTGSMPSAKPSTANLRVLAISSSARRRAFSASALARKNWSLSNASSSCTACALGSAPPSGAASGGTPSVSAEVGGSVGSVGDVMRFQNDSTTHPRHVGTVVGLSRGGGQTPRGGPPVYSDSMKLRSRSERVGCLSLRTALDSICRIRSRVTSNCLPTSSRV